MNMDTFESSFQLRAVYTLLDIIHLHSDVVADVSTVVERVAACIYLHVYNSSAFSKCLSPIYLIIFNHVWSKPHWMRGLLYMVPVYF
jgi:hypothetical protein